MLSPFSCSVFPLYVHGLVTCTAYCNSHFVPFHCFTFPFNLYSWARHIYLYYTNQFVPFLCSVFPFTLPDSLQVDNLLHIVIITLHHFLFLFPLNLYSRTRYMYCIILHKCFCSISLYHLSIYLSLLSLYLVTSTFGVTSLITPFRR